MPTSFNLDRVHHSWRPCLEEGLKKIDPHYLTALSVSQWLPGPDKLFNAFSLPLEKVNYVLMGESPYPRAASANGYAFWDADVHDLWSPTGLSKKVNRATSLRNIFKMLLIAEGLLSPPHLTQTDIAQIPKQSLIKTNEEFFTQLLNHGFLLLNATPVLQASAPQKDARAWKPFTTHVIEHLIKKRPNVTFLLLGNIANTINAICVPEHLNKICAEHPYNVSFITNPTIIEFFKPMHLLRNE